MWDRSFRRQRVLHMVAGAAVVLAAAVGLVLAARTAVAERLGQALRSASNRRERRAKSLWSSRCRARWVLPRET